HSLLDIDKPVIENEAVLFPLLNCGRKGLEDMIVGVRSKRRRVAFPIGLEDHLIGRLRAFEKATDIKAGIRGKKGPNAGTGRWQIGQVRAVTDARLDRRGAIYSRFDDCFRIGSLENRLLLMPGALSENAVEPQANEQCHQCEDDDYGQLFSSDPLTFNVR